MLPNGECVGSFLSVMLRLNASVTGLRRGLLRIVLVVSALVMLSVPIRAETAADRFFLMGNGRIDIKNMHNGKEAAVNLLTADGSFNEEGFARIDEVFGFPTGEKGEHISRRLIFMLNYFSDLVAPGKTIKLVSGYRSPDYNTKIRDAGGNVAKTSLHMDGMAIDFSIDGVRGKKLWEIIKSKDCCGIGNYGSDIVHLDSGKPRFWEAATSKVRTEESDNNRRIYLSTDYDRYMPGDTVRLSFSSVSEFGFGVGRAVAFVDDAGGNGTAATGEITFEDNSECAAIRDRNASHSISLPLPASLRNGRYRIRIDFCRRPFEQMPSMILSNEIEVVRHGP